MILSKKFFFNWLRMLAAPAIVFSVASAVSAQVVYMTIDGRDVANLAGDGNHAPFHSPPVGNIAFAFTFGGVVGDNPDAGPGDPPTATETNFNFTGNDFGGLGFGTAAGGDTSFPLTAVYEMDITVNPGNTLAVLNLNLKDADAPLHLIEEHQYPLVLGAPGTKTLTAVLAAPVFTNTPRDGIANFDPANGLTELQLQYPFSAGGTGAVLDITIHEIRIQEFLSPIVPEPSTMLTAAIGLVLVGGFRRIKNR